MLLYIDSRAATTLLDETVGNMNWQSEFYSVNGKTMCKIGIYDEDRNIWVWKTDTGSESNVEADKGQISDCYKRVLTRFGVTELYSAPAITIPDDGYKCLGYKVGDIQYNNNREIVYLSIVNRFGKEVFNWNINNNNNTNNNVKQVNQNNYVYDNNTNITNNVNNGFNEDFIDDVIEEMESRGNCYGTIKPKTVNITNEDKLNNWYNNQDKNNVEVNKFYNYYTKTLEKGTWKGNLNPELLYTKWCASAR